MMTLKELWRHFSHPNDMFMIAKIAKSGSNFQGAIKYNNDKTKQVNQATRKPQAALINRHLIKNTDPKAAAKEFDDLSKYSNSSRKVMHISLSFHPKDAQKLTTGKLINISKEYLKGTGYEKQPRLIYQHFDTDHPHVHIVTSRVDVNTNKLIKDNFERLKSKKVTADLELKYGLTIADKRQSKQQSASYQKSAAEVERAVKKALRNSPKSIKELSSQMMKNGSDIRVKEVGKGIVYFRENKETGKLGKLRKGSDFKHIGVDKRGLISVLSNNKEMMMNLKKVIYKEQSSSLGGLENNLKKYGIRPKYSMGSKGSINGMSFQYKGQNYKASSIDKDLSWNKVKVNYNDIRAITAREQVMQPYRKLSENLKEAAFMGEKISIKFRENRYNFEIPNNPAIVKQLSDIRDNEPDGDTISSDIAKRHNKGIVTADKSATFHLDKYIDENAGRRASSLELAERLKATMERGSNIGRKYENSTIIYISHDKALESQLNKLNTYDAGRLFTIANEGIEKKDIVRASMKIDREINDIGKDNSYDMGIGR